jgi:tetratricopeptide (TPR) repeat protein
VSRTREGEPRALRKRLTGDVDNLVLYALRKEPERRYQSAQQLCDDIQAHLDDRPLPIARPESRTYHVRKTLRRYRFALAAVAAIVVALSAGLGTALHLYGKAQIARQEAEAARVRADERARETMQLAKLPSQILRAIDTDAIESQLMDGLRERTHTALKGQYIGDWRTRRKRTAQEIEVDLASYDERSRSIQRWDIVQKAMGEHVVRAAAEAIRGFETQPLVQAEMQYAVGTGYLNAETAMFAEPHVRIALQIRERELGTDHVDTLNTLSAMGTVLSMQGKMVEAEDCHRRELFGRQRVQGVSHPDTLSARYELARVLSWEGKLSEAEVYFRAALHGYRRVLGDDHEKSLNCMNYMGIVLQRQGKLEEAEAFYRERLERNLRMCDICPTTLASIESLGRLLVEQHQLAEAENLFREALGKYGWVMRGGAGGQNLLQPTLDLVTCLGGLLNESGRYSEAVATLIDAEAVFRRTNHAFPGQRDLGQYLIELGKAHHGDENYGDAEAALLEAYDLLSSFECPLGSPRCQPGLDNTKERCVAALVELYEDWNAVEPEAGYAQKAVDWCEKGSAPRVHARIPFER